MKMISIHFHMAALTGSATAPLLPNSNDIVNGVVDYKNRPVHRSKSGGWRSASFIMGVELAERFAYYGISMNLITFLTGPLAQSTVTAAANVNAWYGTASLLPLLGAFVADSFLGRYRTIIISSLIYVVGLALLTFSAIFTSWSSTASPSQIQIIFFFFSLYLVAVAQGGHKPCVQAFGADQFDADDPEERKAKSSFFNWWYCCVCGGTTVNLVVLTYIQDNLGWVLGFGIPCIAMAISTIVYLFGTMTYRYSRNGDDEKNPFIRIGQVFVKAIKNWRITPLEQIIDQEARGTLPHQSFQQFKFLNKALLLPDGSKSEANICSMNDVEEAKAILRLVPIWASCFVYTAVFAQSPTFFTKQGMTLNRSLGSGFEIPPAALQFFITLPIVIIIPIYDLVFVPCARAITGKPSGITMLQRIGVGIGFSIISMLIAALVEMKRLQTARDYGLVDKPDVTIPMDIWWLVPQYVIFGIADVFTMVGLQEFFYDQVPSELKSVGLALYLSIFGVGSFLSSFLISIIEKTTGSNGQDSWFSDNLNRGHLDYFYWFLGGLSTISAVVYLYFARTYVYKRTQAV